MKFKNKTFVSINFIYRIIYKYKLNGRKFFLM